MLQFLKKKPKLIATKNSILPEGFFKIVNADLDTLEGTSPSNEFVVEIMAGPFKQYFVEITNKIKFRSEALTGDDQMLYTYRVVQPANVSFDEDTLLKLNRIVAAIVCDIYADMDINSILNPNND